MRTEEEIKKEIVWCQSQIDAQRDYGGNYREKIRVLEWVLQ